MKIRNILLFTFFTLITTPFLFYIFNSGGPGYFSSLWDGLTLYIVNLGGILIFLSIFQNTSSSSKQLSEYKLIWLQELFIILGIFGSVIGFTMLIINMEIPTEPSIDPLASFISGIAIGSLALIYGFWGAIVAYMLQKYHEMQSFNNYNEIMKEPKEGFRLSSFIYIIFYIILIVLILAISSADAGGIFVFPFQFESIFYIGIISIILILFYKGSSFINLLKNIFWYTSDTENNIKYNLKFLRNIKKILSMIISVSLLCSPIMMLNVVAMPPQESTMLNFNSLSLSGLKHGGTQFFWILSTIILLTIIEGREVTKLYHLTGKISAGDRYYSIKYVLGPMFLMLFIFTIGVIQSLLF